MLSTGSDSIYSQIVLIKTLGLLMSPDDNYAADQGKEGLWGRNYNDFKHAACAFHDSV